MHEEYILVNLHSESFKTGHHCEKRVERKGNTAFRGCVFEESPEPVDHKAEGSVDVHDGVGRNAHPTAQPILTCVAFSAFIPFSLKKQTQISPSVSPGQQLSAPSLDPKSGSEESPDNELTHSPPHWLCKLLRQPEIELKLEPSQKSTFNQECSTSHQIRGIFSSYRPDREDSSLLQMEEI
ncbi:hypothetical protein F2P79_007936 [Pimephales promelas]|nr:hypothetical protein F2P79_007936 [Pimephales promelas]